MNGWVNMVLQFVFVFMEESKIGQRIIVMN